MQCILNQEKIDFTLHNRQIILQKAIDGQQDVSLRFNWENITDQYIALFKTSN